MQDIRSGCQELLELGNVIENNKKEMKQRIQELQLEIRQSEKRVKQLESDIIKEMIRKKLSCFKMNNIMFWIESPSVFQKKEEKLKHFFETCPPSVLSTYTPDNLVKKIVTLQKKRVCVQKPETFIDWKQDNRNDEEDDDASKSNHSTSSILSKSSLSSSSYPLYRLRRMVLPTS